MKVKKLAAGATIEAGDYIQIDNWAGKRWHKVVRVTPKFAMVKWNDVAEGKFRREVDANGYAREAGNTDIWSTTKYTAWSPIAEEANPEGEKEEVKS